jgi:hypothetical protein
VHGYDGGGREIDVWQLAAGFMKNLTQRHGNQLQMGSDAPEFSRGQGGEKMVLIGTPWDIHIGPPKEA